MSRMELAGMLSIMASAEKPVYAWAMPAARVPSPTRQPEAREPGWEPPAKKHRDSEDRDREPKEDAQKTRHADLDLSDGKGALEGTRPGLAARLCPAIYHDLELATPSTACKAAAVAMLAAVPTTCRSEPTLTACQVPSSRRAPRAATPRIAILPEIARDDSQPRGNRPHTR